MDYSECLAYIESLSPTLEKPGLTRIKAFMACHGDWQNLYKVIHVAGTNGKGSTVALLDSIARGAGYKVGRFTGPHLLRWNERFHLNGQPISDDDFARAGTYIRELSEEFARDRPDLGQLTWFEFLTAIAFYWFAQNNVDVAVIEVGLGGRFDATNVVQDVLVSVITNIDLDHTHILGGTVELIAAEKAGIIKDGVTVVTGATGAALSVIRTRAQEHNCKLVEVDQLHLDALPAQILETFEACKNSLSLVGAYQEMNGLLAVTAIAESGLMDSLSDPRNAIRNGFREAFWPGRMHFVGAQNLILDGAHNPAGAVALRNTLDRLRPNASFRFVIGCFENKNVEKIVGALVRTGDKVYASQAVTKRATYNKEQISTFCQGLGAESSTYESIADAFHAARKAQKDEMIVVTGSFATVREVMFALGWTSVEDGRPEWVKISDVQ